ncbi:MAG: AIR synthase-related protein [Promethearchaeia archaeon]
MSDLEGLTRRLMEKGVSDEKIIERLVQEYRDFKDITKKKAKILATAVLEECEKSNIKHIENPFIRDLLDIHKSNVTVGKQGVGCRGVGDFFVHKLIADLSETEKKAYLSPTSLDDAGAIRLKDLKTLIKERTVPEDLIIVSKMEGIHSRLSDFPFICGFHVTRAALRDLYVKGAFPISIMIDTHLGDDADVGKLFDFMGGVSAVSELTDVPITAGSTLRIGGDMVIGNRLVGGIAGVGIAKKRLLARRNIEPGDKILMTEGAGGGTISTTAIYSGNHEVVKETLNIKFIEAVETLLNSDYLEDIRAMCDVTNGGLRGDLYEINYEAECGVKIYEKEVRSLVNQNVLNLLESVNVDYLGVSLDALLIYCKPTIVEAIISDLQEKNVDCKIIGEVNNTQKVSMVYEEEKEENILPRFRESPYTKVKQEIGESTPKEREKMEDQIKITAEKALKKRKKIIDFIQNNG